MTQETELPALPTPRCYGLLRPDGSIDESLIGSRADCEYWSRAENEEQSGWEIVGIYTAFDMCAAVLAERGRAACAHVALAELVALKDMKDHLTALRSDPYYVTQADALESQYKARKPAAWEAARAAVKEG